MNPELSGCIVWELEEVLGPDGKNVLTHLECPLLTLSRNVSFVSSNLVVKTVSIVHLCCSTCSIVESLFCHDYTNDLFCLNIYCIGNYY